jgi:phosphatidylglycerophosphate synthase
MLLGLFLKPSRQWAGPARRRGRHIHLGEAIMAEIPFGGDRKEPIRTLTAPLERRFVEWATPRVPQCLGSHHLTLMTLAWSALLILSAWLAGRGSRHWLWGSSLMLFLQWLTDSLDGAVGRWRDAGLRRWGFFMDHFLDYVFMACAMGQYAFVTDGRTRVLFLVLVPLYGALEACSWLEFGATGKFRISNYGVGPTEGRILLILLNTTIIFFGTAWLGSLLPPFMILLALLLAANVHGAHKRAWAMDMEERDKIE